VGLGQRRRETRGAAQGRSTRWRSSMNEVELGFVNVLLDFATEIRSLHIGVSEVDPRPKAPLEAALPPAETCRRL
jgi:hypothetical protein